MSAEPPRNPVNPAAHAPTTSAPTTGPDPDQLLDGPFEGRFELPTVEHPADGRSDDVRPEQVRRAGHEEELGDLREEPDVLRNQFRADL